ncbi:hypothetical protein Y032_0005g2284 [Ancylostoma ceylanicum]|uniref:Uncharacterized protein n=1 Tax=Ancylostoma ceylanicum TaxID=53326 RepID=A0A016VST2_9BILA|nr:hypothetical protein Y032_0005g2284 [Ancylostoma ceylanicum]
MTETLAIQPTYILLPRYPIMCPPPTATDICAVLSKKPLLSALHNSCKKESDALLGIYLSVFARMLF